MGAGYKIGDRYEMYFVTFQVVYWIDLFSRKDYADVFIENLIFYRKNKGLNVHAFVIMSNHVHLILSATDAMNDLSSLIGQIKSFTSKQFVKKINEINESRKEWMLKLFAHAATAHKRNSTYQVWTHDNHPIVLDTDEMLWQRFNYLHENPVRAEIVEKPEDYLYSSARNYFGLFSTMVIDKVEIIR